MHQRSCIYPGSDRAVMPSSRLNNTSDVCKRLPKQGARRLLHARMSCCASNNSTTQHLPQHCLSLVHMHSQRLPTQPKMAGIQPSLHAMHSLHLLKYDQRNLLLQPQAARMQTSGEVHQQGAVIPFCCSMHLARHCNCSFTARNPAQQSPCSHLMFYDARILTVLTPLRCNMTIQPTACSKHA